MNEEAVESLLQRIRETREKIDSGKQPADPLAEAVSFSLLKCSVTVRYCYILHQKGFRTAIYPDEVELGAFDLLAKEIDASLSNDDLISDPSAVSRLVAASFALDKLWEMVLDSNNKEH